MIFFGLTVSSFLGFLLRFFLFHLFFKKKGGKESKGVTEKRRTGEPKERNQYQDKHHPYLRGDKTIGIIMKVSLKKKEILLQPLFLQKLIRIIFHKIIRLNGNRPYCSLLYYKTRRKDA